MTPRRIEIDHQRRRVALSAGPGFSGTNLGRATADLFRSEPETASYDFIIDVRGSTTGATQADLRIVLDTYAKTPREPGLKFACYVTTDPLYHLWTTAMDDLFGDRRNLPFPTVEEAVAFLDAQRQGA